MRTTQNTRLGISLMIATTAIFALQDALSRQLGSTLPISMVLAVRYWFMAAWVILFALRRSGGLKAAATTAYPWLQILRGLLLVGEIGLMVLAFVQLGLIETHAVFIVYPLLVTLLSGPVLGEKVGWRRWLAVLVGFAGVLIILNPGSGIFTAWAILPLASAFMFALYNVLTRYVAQEDSSNVSLFWLAIVGAIVITPIGIYNWQPLTSPDIILLAIICVTSSVSHFLLIKAYDVAEAADIQPFAFFQLPFIAFIGLTFFDEELRSNVIFGGVIVVSAGLFTLWRQRMRAKAARRAATLSEAPPAP